jgi:hypothetical protein
LTIEYPFAWTAGEATADRIHYGEGQSHELRIKGIQMQTLVEDVLGLNSQTLENRLWRPFQAVIAKADLNYGFAMPESRQMFSFSLAAPNKAREYCPIVILTKGKGPSTLPHHDRPCNKA